MHMDVYASVPSLDVLRSISPKGPIVSKVSTKSGGAEIAAEDLVSSDEDELNGGYGDEYGAYNVSERFKTMLKGSDDIVCLSPNAQSIIEVKL